MNFGGHVGDDNCKQEDEGYRLMPEVVRVAPLGAGSSKARSGVSGSEEIGRVTDDALRRSLNEFALSSGESVNCLSGCEMWGQEHGMEVVLVRVKVRTKKCANNRSRIF